MAGALHKDYERTLIGGGMPLVPGSKLVKAYAEGYNAQRAGTLQAANPFPDPVTDIDNNARAWDQGWRDAEAGHPSTHVGGAAGVPPPSPPAPEPEEDDGQENFLTDEEDED